MCSMLCCLANTDYGAPDDDDYDLVSIHAQFTHSAAIADAHYGIQGTNALSTVSHTSVRSMQCVSTHWHACLGCSHSNEQENEQRPLEEDRPMQLWSTLKIPLTSCIQDVSQEAIQDFFNRVLPHWTSILEGVGSDLMLYISLTFLSQSAMVSSRLSPLIFHPMLASRMRPLYPGPELFYFKSHYQAELVQRCLTNNHVLAVMPTRSGKSLAFFAAPLLNPSSLFIVVTPFVALTEDMDRRLTACPGIRGGKWSCDTDPINDQLIIVPAHEARSDQF